MEAQCKDGVRDDGVASLIVAAGERRGLLGVGFENMMRSWSMRKFAGENSFCVLMYMNSDTFHICFILFILLSYLIFDFVCLTLSSADTHGDAKYARTYTRDTYTRTHAKQGKR